MKNIRKILIEKYKLNNIKNVSLLREGVDNCVFKIILENRKVFILRVSKRAVEDDINFELDILLKLFSKGAKVAPPIENLNGEMFSKDHKGTIYTLFSFMKGSSIEISPTKKPEISKVFTAGSELGNLHNIAAKISSDYKKTRTIFTEIERILYQKNKFSEIYNDSRIFLDMLEEYYSWSKNEAGKQIVIHNDYRPSNVFFHQKKVSAILDLDWSCMGPAIKDLALAAVEWSYPDGAEKYWRDSFESFIEGYNKTCKTKVDIDSVFYKWAAFSCLSDSCTYFADLIESNKTITEKKELKSYMYNKFKFFNKLSKTK